MNTARTFRFVTSPAFTDAWPNDTLDVHGTVFRMGPDGKWHDVGMVYTVTTCPAPATVRSASKEAA